MSYRNLVHFKMLASQVANSCDEMGGLTDEQVMSVYAAFNELRIGQHVEAWDYLRNLMLENLNPYSPDANLPKARAYMTLHKAVTC